MVSPLTPQQILEEAAIKDLPGVYVLGSHHRHITVFSQQVRAVNLVESLLLGQAKFKPQTTIAIVGAGISGLTAAAYAAILGATVTVFEQALRPLWLQENSNNRWLHPHIYDWPEPESLEPRTLVLPVLNWRAGSAREVAAQIREEWEYEVATRARLQNPLYGRKVVNISSNSERVQLSWKCLLGENKDCGLHDIAKEEQGEFQYVILAVGFGLEGGSPGTVSYWNDDDGLNGLNNGERILISGSGDGALADLMRLSLRDFRQDQIVRLIQSVDLKQIGSDLMIRESLNVAQPESLDQWYRDLKVDTVIGRLEELRDKRRTIYLARKGPLFGTRSAVLNRFIVSQLQKLRDPPAFEERPAYKAFKEGNNGKFLVTFENGKSEEFDRIVLRHGPSPVLADFRNIWDQIEPRRRHWRETPQSLDKTRIPISERSKPTPDLQETIGDLESYESSSDMWCLVLHPANTTTHWALLAQGALRECKVAVEQQLLRSLNIVPLVISITDALKNVNTYRRIVRALSQADIVIADVSGYDPGIMMLLGIRSVVRRGVSITTTDQEINAEVWSNIPFNLKEINPLSHRSENRLRLSQFSEAIREALTQLERSPFYQDLPVYDYVRNFGKSYSDYEPVRKQKRVLFLRSFRNSYQPDIWEFVRQSFKLSLAEETVQPPKENNEPRLESIIDESSPRLVGQRLYEAIRLTDLCVVDFTDWRPNVFYELGVRLSVHKLGPICIINSDEANQQLSRTQKSLQELFRPFEYRLGGPQTPFRNALKAFEEMQTFRVDGYYPNNAALAHDETYRIVSRNFTLRQERFGDSVEDFLISSVDVVAGGGDDLQNVDPTLLYGRENAALARKIREGVLERLCAVWLYTDGREQPSTFTMYDILDPRKRSILRKYRQISVRLLQKLEGRMAERDQKLRQLISQRLVGIRKLSDLDDNINEWEMLEKTRPYESNTKEFQNYIQDYIEVIQPLLETLEKLKNIKSESLYDKIQAGLHKVKVWEQRTKVDKL